MSFAREAFLLLCMFLLFVIIAHIPLADYTWHILLPLASSKTNKQNASDGKVDKRIMNINVLVLFLGLVFQVIINTIKLGQSDNLSVWWLENY